MTTPLWFLDVDGVLNSDRNPPPRLGGPYTHVDITTEPDHTFPIWYDPTLIDRLNTLTSTGQVTIWWLTTWGHHAVTHLAPTLGLTDTYPVAAPPPGVPVSDVPDMPGHRHHWWKTAAAHAVLEQHNPTRFIWTDDELRKHTKNLIRARWTQPSLLLTTPSTPGLTHTDLDTITDFLRAYPQDQQPTPERQHP